MTNRRLDRTDPLTRIETARREVGHTDVQPAVAAVLVIVFLLVVAGFPMVQAAVDAGFYATAWSTLGNGFRTEPQLEERSLVQRLFIRNRSLLASIQDFDDLVSDHSLGTRVMRPGVQHLLTALFQAGTEQVHQGTDGWLFYAPDLAYATGKGFLAPRQLRRRAASGDTLAAAPQPDPRVAIFDLQRQLAARNIELIVMPTPVKPSVHPEWLGDTDPAGGPLASNVSYASFVEQLRRDGVLVFDVSAELAEAKRTHAQPLFLTTDTHWRPGTVELVAERLAGFVRQHTALPDVSPTPYRATPAVVTNEGDTTQLLDLPSWQRLYQPETVTIRRVGRADGTPWRPDPDAEILLLGDSFTNVFSLGAMGWGDAAGLAEQLSFVLQRPVDRLTQNDNGAYASRDLLGTEQQRGTDRLSAKAVVIYQFANRELGQGDWRLVDLGLVARPSFTSFVTPAAGLQLQVRGVVQELGRIPRPGSVPYKDHIVGVHVSEVTVESVGASADGDELSVYLWSMQDNQLTPVSTLRVGDTIRLQLEAWSNVAGELEGINRSEVDDPAARLAAPWWGRVVEAR